MSAMVQFHIKATKYTAEATTITTENPLYLGLFLCSRVTDRRMGGGKGKLSGRGKGLTSADDMRYILFTILSLPATFFLFHVSSLVFFHR